MKHSSEAQSFLAYVTTFFQNEGGRMTKARTNIVLYLIAHGEGVSMQQIIQDTCSDEVSVYRTITRLRNYGLIEDIRISAGETLLALSVKHHHHIVCTVCQKVKHVPCNDTFTLSKPPAGFQRIASHEVTWYGVCTGCSVEK
jgi:Fe2+ or Zn2+ uptake regulation protein